MSNKFMEKIEEKLMPIGAKLGQQRHLKALRDGVMGTVPLTIIGGISLILAFPPVNSDAMEATNIFSKMILIWVRWATANFDAIMAPYKLTMAIMAIFVAMGVSYSLAKAYKMEAFTSAVTSAVTFLLVAAEAEMMAPVRGYASMVPVSAAKSAIPMEYLDAKGMFTAMLIGLLTVEITLVLIRRNMYIKMPEGVPPAVTSSFASLVPMIVNLAVFYGLSMFVQNVYGHLLPEVIMTFLTPALDAVDSVWIIMLLVFFSQAMWLIGVHGVILVRSVIGPISVSNVMANAAAKVSGEAMPFVFNDPLWMFYILLGGSGATLALVFLLLRSKSSHLKAVGRIGLLPGLFNINEPIIFGTPVILNPIMALPFVFVPVINTLIAYQVTEVGLVSRSYLMPPWTSPAIIGAPLSTMDWRAAILVLVLFVIDVAIYYPFFKAYEKQLIEAEAKEEAKAIYDRKIV